MRGILAVWNDCAAGAEADYERWYRLEHLPERLGVPGFLFGYRYRAMRAGRAYFTYYETETAAVLSSETYLERLENPTPWTRRIMPSFTNASRTVCELVERTGDIVGGRVVTCHWRGAGGAFDALLREFGESDGVTRAQLWRASGAQTPATSEARSRGAPDELISGALVVDCLADADAEAVSARIETAVPRNSGAAEIGIYAFHSSLAAVR